MINIIALYIILGIILAVYIILRFSIKITYYVNSKTDEIELSVKWLGFKIYPRPDKPVKVKKNKTKSKKKLSKDEPSKTVQERFDISEIDDEFIDEAESDLDDKIMSLEKELEIQKQALIQNEETHKINEKAGTDKVRIEAKKKKRHIKESAKSQGKDGGLKSKINKIKETWKKYKDYVPMTWKAFRKLLKQIRFYDTEIEITAGKDDAYDAAMLYGKLNTLLFSGLGVVGLIFSLYKPKKAEVKCVFDKKVFECEVSGKIRLRPSTILGIVICLGVKFSVMFLRKRHKVKKQYKLKRKLMLNKQKELLANEG